MALSSFERWKRDYPVTYEILFNLFYRWSQACTNRNGYDKIEHLWGYHKSSMGRWKTTDPAVAKNVWRYEILDIYFSRPGRKLSFQAEFEYMNGLGEMAKTKLTTDFIGADTLYAIENEALDYFNTKVIGKPIADKEEDKPTYKKPGITYQHVSTVKASSTETQKEIERIIKNSSYGMQANEKYLASTIKGAIRKKLINENDISVGDFEGVKDAFSFEYYGTTFKAYVKSIAYVTAEDHPGATWKKIALHDLIVSTDDNQGTELDIRVDSVACYGAHFDLRRGGLTDAITGVHISRIKREWADYIQRKHMRLGKTAVHHLEPITPVTYNPADVELCTDFYNYLNEKETKEMKKLIINHNAVIVLTGAKDSYGKEKKTVVNILDHDTKKERGQWNTKLAVVSAIAKSFEHHRDGKLSTCYKLYEMLNTIKKPTNATIDFVADEMCQNNKRLKCCKWYQEAIKVKRPAPGKSVVIVMEDK